MADEPLDPKMVELVRDAIARGASRSGFDEPIDKPPVLTGRDAAVIREIARQMVDERLRERRLLSDLEIQSVAKDIAHTIFDQAIGDIKDSIPTEEEIKALIVAKLKEAGVRADDAHIDETRKTLENLQDGHKRRSQLSTDFVREVLKALVGYSVAGLSGVAVTYFFLKGGSH